MYTPNFLLLHTVFYVIFSIKYLRLILNLCRMIHLSATIRNVGFILVLSVLYLSNDLYLNNDQSITIFTHNLLRLCFSWPRSTGRRIVCQVCISSLTSALLWFSRSYRAWIWSYVPACFGYSPAIFQ